MNGFISIYKNTMILADAIAIRSCFVVFIPLDAYTYTNVCYCKSYKRQRKNVFWSYSLGHPFTSSIVHIEQAI